MAKRVCAAASTSLLWACASKRRARALAAHAPAERRATNSCQSPPSSPPAARQLGAHILSEQKHTMDRAMQELLLAQLAPAPVRAVALIFAALAAVAALLYVLVDAVRYSRIPTLDVPLTEGVVCVRAVR